MKTAALNRFVGVRIFTARKAKHMTQAELAQLIGQSRTSVVNMEAGRQGIPMSTLYDIAVALEVDITELIPKTGESLSEKILEVRLDGKPVALTIRQETAIRFALRKDDEDATSEDTVSE